MKQQPVSPEKDGYKRRCSRTDKEVLVSQIKTLNIRRHKRLFVLQLLSLPAALGPTRFTAFKFQQYCSNKGKYNEIFYADLLELYPNKPSELKFRVCISEQQENVPYLVLHVFAAVRVEKGPFGGTVDRRINLGNACYYLCLFGSTGKPELQPSKVSGRAEPTGFTRHLLRSWKALLSRFIMYV